MTTDTEAAQQQAELDQLEYTVSQEALESVGAGHNQVEQPEDEETAALLHMLSVNAKALFLPNWDITDPEFEAFSQSGGKLLDKYFPDGLGVEKYKEEIAFAGVVFGIWYNNKDKPFKAPADDQEGGDSATETE